MGFITEDQLDPVGAAPSSGGGRFITEDMLDPVQGGVDGLLGQDATATQRAARVGVGGLSQFIPFGDEIVAGGSALVDKLRGSESLGDSYDARLKEVRDYQEAFNKQSDNYGGIASPAVKLGGALALPGGLAKNASSLTGKIGLTALEGGAVGALYGADAQEGGLEQRLQGAKEGATTGAALSAAIGAPLLTAQKYLPGLDKAGKAMQRSSLGARASDYKKGFAQTGVWDVVDDAVESDTKKILNNLIDSGQLGKSRDPEKLYATVLQKQKDLGDDIGAVINRAEGRPVSPNFSQTYALLESGKIPADEVNRYLKDVVGLEEAIAEQGKGSLKFLQQQKIAIGTRYKPDDKISNLYNRTLYHDLQKSIEEAVPEIKPLNRELQQWIVLEPIVKRGAALEESANAAKSTVQGLRTTGGVLMGPTAIGTMLGGPGGGAAGALSGAALTALQTPAGKNFVGAGLRTLSKGSSIFGGAGEKVPSIFGTLAAASLDPQQNPLRSSQPESLMELGAATQDAMLSPLQSEPSLLRSGQLTTSRKKDQLQQGGKANQSPQNTPDDKFLNTLLDAIRQVESGGNDKAISPAGAKGPYQFTDATAKDYGLEDPFDPEASRQAALSKVMDDWERFGDLRLALAAFNAGAGRVGKLLKRVEGDSYEDIAHLLPRETKAYVPKIEKVFAKLMG